VHGRGEQWGEKKKRKKCGMYVIQPEVEGKKKQTKSYAGKKNCESWQPKTTCGGRQKVKMRERGGGELDKTAGAPRKSKDRKGSEAGGRGGTERRRKV